MKSAGESVSTYVLMKTDQYKKNGNDGNEYLTFVPSCSNSHCTLHRQAIVVKAMQTSLKYALY
jgi:hypothetical protein